MLSAATVLLVCAARASWAQFSTAQLGRGVTHAPVAGAGPRSAGVPVLFGSAAPRRSSSGATFGGLLVSGFDSISYLPLSGTPGSLGGLGGTGSVTQLGLGSLGTVTQPRLSGVPLTRRHFTGLSIPSAFSAQPSLTSFSSAFGTQPSFSSFSSAFGTQPSFPRFSSAFGAQPSFPRFSPAFEAQPSFPRFSPAFGAQPSFPRFSSAFGAQPSFPRFSSAFGAQPSFPGFSSAFGAQASLSTFPAVTSFSSGGFSGLGSFGVSQLPGLRPGLALRGLTSVGSSVAGLPQLGLPLTTGSVSGGRLGTLSGSFSAGLPVSFAPVAVARPRVVNLASQSGAAGGAITGLGAAGFNSVSYSPLLTQRASSRGAP